MIIGGLGLNGGGSAGDQNNKGSYLNISALQSIYPVGQAGWFAIIDATNTIWTWKTSTNQWVDTVQTSFLLNRANHINTQLASTISDFQNTVNQNSTLNSKENAISVLPLAKGGTGIGNLSGQAGKILTANSSENGYIFTTAVAPVVPVAAVRVLATNLAYNPTQLQLQNHYNSFTGLNAPDLPPISVLPQHVSGAGFELYLGHNTWYFRSDSTNQSWTGFNGGKDAFGQNVAIIYTYK